MRAEARRRGSQSRLPSAHGLLFLGEARALGWHILLSFALRFFFFFSRSEVSTLKDLFGLASNGRHPLRSWRVGLVCVWVEMLNECSCLSTHLGAKMPLYF